MEDKVVYICDFGRESIVRQNTKEEISGSGKNYTLLLNEAGDYAVFTMSDEQNKKCKEKNESFIKCMEKLRSFRMIFGGI